MEQAGGQQTIKVDRLLDLSNMVIGGKGIDDKDIGAVDTIEDLNNVTGDGIIYYRHVKSMRKAMNNLRPNEHEIYQYEDREGYVYVLKRWQGIKNGN